MRFKRYDKRVPVFTSKLHPPKPRQWYSEIWKRRNGDLLQFVRGKKKLCDPPDMEEVGWCWWCAGVCGTLDRKGKLNYMTSSPTHYVPPKPCSVCAENVKEYTRLKAEEANISLKLRDFRHPLDPK